MYQNPAFLGLKRHARTSGSDVFPRTWRTHQRRGISIPEPHLEGNVWPNGSSCNRFGQQQGSTELLGGSYLPRFQLRDLPIEGDTERPNYAIIAHQQGCC